MADIFQFVDYRAFLRAYFEEQKAKSKVFSHEYFAHKAGIHSSGFLLHVMKGQRNLTKPVLLQVARAIGLNTAQTEYFEDLVSFDQAKNQTDKQYYFDRIAAKRKTINVTTLEDRQYEFYSAWHHSVIRELITLLRDNADTKTLAKLVVPSITPTQVKKSLKLQEALGLLKKDKAGKYRQADSFVVGGGSPVRNLAVVNFQKAMLKLALESWDRFAAKDMTMHTATICIPEDLVESIRQEARKFKEKVFKIAGADQRRSERVYHLNINFFPVCKAEKGD